MIMIFLMSVRFGMVRRILSGMFNKISVQNAIISHQKVIFSSPFLKKQENLLFPKNKTLKTVRKNIIFPEEKLISSQRRLRMNRFFFPATAVLFLAAFALFSQVPGAKGRVYSPKQGNTRYYDASGRLSGTARKSGSRTEYRDSSGRLIGTAHQSGNRVTFRDASGRSTGSATRSGNNVTYRDASGRVTQRTSRSGNQVTIRDASGRHRGTLSRSGSTVYRRSSTGQVVERNQ